MASRLVCFTVVSLVYTARCLATPSQAGLSCSASTICAKRDTCCPLSVSKDLEDFFGCMPPNASHMHGCNASSSQPDGCCCAPGPANVSSTLPNVLIIGDSFAAGYLPYLRKALLGTASVSLGPDGESGRHAAGSAYGQLCVDSFVRTPARKVTPWSVIAFNFGLLDVNTSVADYRANLVRIVDHLESISAATGAELLFLTTTMPGGSREDPADPAAAHVLELNAAGLNATADRAVAVVDLHAAMKDCGDACEACRPHCEAEGYSSLVIGTIVGAIKAALPHDVFQVFQ